MRRNLGLDELDGFLEEPLVAVLATHRPDGSVLLSPVWHRWHEGGFEVWVGSEDVKARHLRRDPRATIVVAESALPLRAVELRTAATIDEGSGAFDAAVAIATRYLGPDAGRAYVESAGGGEAIVRLVPGEVRAWDFADEFG